MKKVLLSVLVLFAALLSAGAQTRYGGVVEINKLVHDFGDIKVTDGPVSCSFTVKNISSKDVTIFNVTTSCGCTDVTWTRESIKPGAVGTIKATYQNEDGPYPFDKSLTAYISDVDKPVVLKMKGVVHAKAVSVKETYPLIFGALGMKQAEIKAGNLTMGEQRSGEITVANVSAAPVKVSFKDVSQGLDIKVVPETIPAGGTAKLQYTVSALPGKYGKQWFYATPVVGGKSYKATGKSAATESAPGAEAILSDPLEGVGPGFEKIAFWTFTKENFASLSKDARKDAPVPYFKASTFEFGSVKAGTKVTATFECSNRGKQPLKVLSVDTGSRKAVLTSPLGDVKASGSGKMTLTLDTAGLPKGECTVIVTLVTNSPIRPLVDLYITGNIK